MSKGGWVLPKSARSTIGLARERGRPAGKNPVVLIILAGLFGYFLPKQKVTLEALWNYVRALIQDISIGIMLFPNRYLRLNQPCPAKERLYVWFLTAETLVQCHGVLRATCG